MMNSFWWGHGVDPKKGVKLETWESLCKGKGEGGMGFRNLHIFNIAMLGKLGWRIQKNTTSLLSCILKAKYSPSCEFFEAPIRHNPSYTWRGIHEVRDLVRRGSKWKVGTRDWVRMWLDPWLNNDTTFRVDTPSVQGFEDMLMRDFFIPDTRLWNVEVVKEVFSEEDATRILKTTP